MEEVGLGRFSGIITLNANAMLFEAVTVIADHAISAIPIVNDEGGHPHPHLHCSACLVLCVPKFRIILTRKCIALDNVYVFVSVYPGVVVDVYSSSDITVSRLSAPLLWAWLLVLMCVSCMCVYAPVFSTRREPG